MKITKQQLKKIVKEEYSNLLDEQGMSGAEKHAAWLAKLKKGGVPGDQLRTHAHNLKKMGTAEKYLAAMINPVTDTVTSGKMDRGPGGTGPGHSERPSAEDAQERGSSWNPLSTDFWAPESADVFDIRGQKSTEIRLPDGSTIKIPLKPGETTDSPAYKQRVRDAIEGAAAPDPSASRAPEGWRGMEEGKITKNMIKKLVQEELGFLNTRIMLEHEDTEAMTADIVGGGDLGDVASGFQHTLDNLQADVTEILTILKQG